MQGRSLSFPGRFIQRNTATGDVSVVVSPNWYTLSFAPTGFGGGNHHSPVSGTFTKSVNSRWQGNIENVIYNGKILKEGTDVYTSYNRNVPTFNWATLDNEALSKFYDQIRGSADLSIDFMEAGKTKKMIKDAFNLVKFVKRFHPNQWAKNWLEYQYGWRPLVGSVYDVVHEFMAPVRGAGVTISARAQRWERLPIEGFGPLRSTSDDAFDSRRVHVQATYNISKPSAIQQIAGYTSLNPASIAWELTPFSFVADWFINIGDYLRNLENSMLYSNNMTDAFVTRTRLVTWMSLSEGPYLGSSGKVFASSQYIWKQRSAGLIMPSLPRFEPKLGWQRLTSAGALLQDYLASAKR